jgi:hypothetical protein
VHVAIVRDGIQLATPLGCIQRLYLIILKKYFTTI